VFRLATRGSALARWQSEHVASLLRAAEPGLLLESWLTAGRTALAGRQAQCS